MGAFESHQGISRGKTIGVLQSWFSPCTPFLSYISLSLYLSTGAGVAPAKELPKSWATPCFCVRYLLIYNYLLIL